jgi:uncharacterized protein (TIRG00374 family)
MISQISQRISTNFCEICEISVQLSHTMRTMTQSRPMMGVLKLALTLLLLFLVFRSVDVSRIGDDLHAFDSWSLILLLTLLWAGQLVCSERWRIFAASFQMKGSYLSFVQMYFTGMFFNIGLPSLIGGDVVKAYIVSRKNSRPLQVGLISVLQDRAVGLISLLFYGTLAILAYPIRWRGFPLWVAYLISWIAAGICIWLVLRGEKLYSKLIKPGRSTFFQKMLKTIAGFHHDLGTSRLRPGEIFRIALYAFFYSALILWVFRQVTVAAGHEVSVIPFSGLYPLVTLATMLPITLGGLGVREWFYVEALSLVGVPRAPALVISLATSALLLLCNLAGLLFVPSIPIDLRSRAKDPSKDTGQP